MDSTTALFFELIQVTIGNRTTLSHCPTAGQWQAMYELSKKHSLAGITYCALTRLAEVDKTKMLALNKILLLKWSGLANKIKEQNLLKDKECCVVANILKNNDIDSIILKGQGNCDYYGHLAPFRTSGDIDVWVRDARDGSIKRMIAYGREVAKANNNPRARVHYHHMELPLLKHGTSDKGTEVEMHYRASWFFSPLRNWRFQRWCQNEYKAVDAHGGFPMPTCRFNVVFQAVHIFRHLFAEGIGLRQMLDYYFVLRAFEQSDENERKDTTKLFQQFGIEKFEGSLMWLLATVFCNEEDVTRDWQRRFPWMVCAPDEKRGKWLLGKVLVAGNFGHYDQSIITTMQFHIGRHSINIPEPIVYATFKTWRNLMLIGHYPEEAISSPFFRLYQSLWRIVN